MHAVMIDIESLGVRPGAVVLSIGAVMFDLNGHELGDEFYVNIDRDEAVQHGLHINDDTVRWWAQQSQEAQDALLVDAKPLFTALMDFQLWLGQHNPITSVWANDPDFDVNLLQAAYEAVEKRWPLKYYLNRSVRTMRALCYPAGDNPSFIDPAGTRHNALDDAKAQARLMQHCWQMASQRLPDEAP